MPIAGLFACRYGFIICS